MTQLIPPHEVFVGRLTQQYVLLPNGEHRLEAPGGNALYALAGFHLWQIQPPPGLVARVGINYPPAWIDEISQHGIDTQGIIVQKETLDLREFIAYPSLQNRVTEQPLAHFSRLGLPFPKSLHGYQDRSKMLDSLSTPTKFTIKKTDIPESYWNAGAFHLAPLDYLTHSLIPAALRQKNISIITVDPSPGYMKAEFWNHIPALVNGLTAFLPSEEELRSLFHTRSSDLREMAEAMASFGCELIIIKRGLGGQFLYDNLSHSFWELPAYPNTVVDPSGAGSSFCGGFLAGYRLTYDPIQALLYGNISASFTVEGLDVWYPLDALPLLAQRRLEVMRDHLQRL